MKRLQELLDGNGRAGRFMVLKTVDHGPGKPAPDLMFQTLADKGINIQVISTSEIKISILIAEEYLELALRALHSAYGLDTD